jgi:RND family efflux transporter MFP subunit
MYRVIFSGFERILGAILLVSMLAAGCERVEPSANAKGLPPVPVKLHEVKLETLDDSTEFSGTLDAAQKVDLKSDMRAQVENVLVEPGERVRKGTVLMTLKPNQTLPQVEQAQEQLTSAQVNRENAVQQLKIAESQQTTARSNYELAKTNYDRARGLVKQGAIGQVTADQAKNQLDAAVHAVETASKQVKTAKAVLTQAEAGVHQAESQLISISGNYQFKQIVSPIAGLVGSLSLKSGDSVSPNQTITTITPNRTLELTISIPPEHFAHLKQGLSVELLDPDTKTRIAVSKLYFMPPRIDTGSQTITARARFTKVEGTLAMGQDARARVIWGKKPGVKVPAAAVMRSGDRSFVFVTQEGTCTPISPRHSAESETRKIACQRYVELGNPYGNSYAVKTGLQPGEAVAISNISDLRDGISILPSP